MAIPMKKSDLIYLAGFIDGEACIFASIKRPSSTKNTHYYPAMHICQKFPGILYWIEEVVGAGHVSLRCDGVAYTYKISGNKCAKLLIALLPYLKGKRNQAELAATMMDLPGEERAVIYRKLQLLKREEGYTSE